MSVTCCFCEPQLTYDLATFLQDINETMLFTAPVATCVVLWKVFVTSRSSPRGDITVLGLDDSAPTYSPNAERAALIRWALLLYLVTGVLAFFAGVLAFETVQALI